MSSCIASFTLEKKNLGKPLLGFKDKLNSHFAAVDIPYKRKWPWIVKCGELVVSMTSITLKLVVFNALDIFILMILKSRILFLHVTIENAYTENYLNIVIFFYDIGKLVSSSMKELFKFVEN